MGAAVRQCHDQVGVPLNVSRRRFKEWEVIATLIEQGIEIPCFRCKQPLPLPTRKNMVQREHIHEITFDGPDIPANCRFSHYDCHSIITNGTKSTSAGSSKQRKAKVDRLASTSLAGSGNTAARGRLATARNSRMPPAWNSRCRRCGADCENGVCPNCPSQTQPTRKLQSRPFQKQEGRG